MPLVVRRLAAQDEAFIITGSVPPSSRIALRFNVSGEFMVTAALSNGKPLPVRTEKGPDVWTVLASTPPTHPFGGRMSFRFKAVNGPAEARDVLLVAEMLDGNRNGIGDAIERLMSPSRASRVVAIPRPPQPQTSFQTGGAYTPETAVPAELALVYSSDETVIRSWRDRGYAVRTMGGFREGPEYARAHPDEVQIDRDGRPLEIGGQSYYLAPTMSRVESEQQYYDAALKAGSGGVCPEEPEYWSRAGYEEAFKREWQQRYGSPWEPPHTGVDARWKSEQLKAYLQRRMIEAILARANEVSPEAVRMMALHSPINYPHWGIVSPHYELLQLPTVQEVIGQVWTGTARTAVRLAGVRSERTFDLAMLEYNSLFNLARGTGKRLWYLMDPVEDQPNLPLADYRRNYHQTLLAAFMNPGVDRFELMPWPERVYGPLPEEYLTEVNSVTGALSELWRYPNARVDSGSAGLATFVSDSMAWQRADPTPSDIDGFYGLALPFVTRGVPVDVLSLDRAVEPGYLDGVRAIMLSYDYLKPRGPEVHAALKEWVRKGGALIILGGIDPYNAVVDSWWKKAGFDSPVEHLMNELGVAARNPKVVSATDNPAPWQPVLRAESAEQELKNRKRHAIDLSTVVKENGSVSVRFEDMSPLDGWGPYVASAELRVNGNLGASFRTGTELEARFLEEDRGSRHNGDARYADGPAYWTYRFDNLPKDGTVTLTVDMGNGFNVRARPARPLPVLTAAGPAEPAFFTRLRIPRPYPLTLYAPPAGASALYTLNGETAPAVWEIPAEKGSVTYCGVAPGYLTSNALASRWARRLGERALARSGVKYQERSFYRVTRGPYTAVRALDRPYTLTGRYIDLLDPTLPLVENPSHDSGRGGLYINAGAERGNPRLLAASGRLRAKAESAAETAWIVQAPTGATGAARLWTGGRRVAAIRSYNVWGAPVSATVSPAGDTLLLKYPNEADGVIVRVVWQ